MRLCRICLATRQSLHTITHRRNPLKYFAYLSGYHEDWKKPTNESRHKQLVVAKRYFNTQGGSPVSIGCELEQYSELKHLIAGTTSVVGMAESGRSASERSRGQSTITDGPESHLPALRLSQSALTGTGTDEPFMDPFPRRPAGGEKPQQ